MIPHSANSPPLPAPGVALLAVLWIIGLLSLLLIALTPPVMEEMRASVMSSHETRAAALAQEGLAIGAHRLVKRGDDVLRQRMDEDGGQGFEARISSAESRLHLNRILANPLQRPVLERLFVLWGLDEPDARALVAAMVDWTDADDLATLNGAEASAYIDRLPPLNRPFRSLDEVLLVRGFEQVTDRKPDWREAFTRVGTGRLSLVDASAELIAAALGVSLNTAERFVADRDGPDGVPGTFDDRPPLSLEDAMRRLGGQNPGAIAVLAGRTKRVDSTGRFGMAEVRLSLVVGSGGRRIEWQKITRFLPRPE